MALKLAITEQITPPPLHFYTELYLKIKTYKPHSVSTIWSSMMNIKSVLILLRVLKYVLYICLLFILTLSILIDDIGGDSRQSN